MASNERYIVSRMANPELKAALSRSLRRRMTVAERRLWGKLRASRFHGLKFQRQEPVGPYIVDFYCSTARFVIELDGDAHSLTSRNDAFRQTYLEKEGLTVVRFPNFEVLHNTGRVLELLYEKCKGHLSSVDQRA